jgi:WD40 repeat protein
VASTAKPWVLVCPGQNIGSLRVQVGEDDSASCVIDAAHKSDLGCLAVNASGTLVASASDYGTVVKVFARNGDLMHTLRRGMRPVTISCLAFRADDRFLAVGSSAKTVHVFRIDVEQTQREREECEITEETSIKTVGESVLGALATYALEPKGFAVFRIPESDTADIRSSCSRMVGPQVGFRGNEPVLLVLHHNGIFYEVGFDEDVQAGARTQECSCPAPTTWFAVRPNFKLMAPSAKVPTVAGGATEEDEEAEEWQLL